MTGKPEKPKTPTTPVAPESISMGERSHTQSRDHLTLRTESTVFSLANSESLWTTTAPPTAWEFYRHAILLMSTGGSVLLAGCVLTGLHFARFTSDKYLGTALLSIGLMVLAVGVVLIPVTREMKQSNSKRSYSHYNKPQQMNL
ncbi:phosphoinositide-interacting protein-like [Engraulis encrasicolus]|uniref:phosphoinositide-interacting protein-like n=1 Tax=Engraulis encrasicolus TaxID=184585 RepID=UPI002FD6DA6F